MPTSPLTKANIAHKSRRLHVMFDEGERQRKAAAHNKQVQSSRKNYWKDMGGTPDETVIPPREPRLERGLYRYRTKGK